MNNRVFLCDGSTCLIMSVILSEFPITSCIEVTYICLSVTMLSFLVKGSYKGKSESSKAALICLHNAIREQGSGKT